MKKKKLKLSTEALDLWISINKKLSVEINQNKQFSNDYTTLWNKCFVFVTHLIWLVQQRGLMTL